ncbi:MAG TPA: ATP-binding protein [Microbacteriaceae bacterium]|nr:ATP-binding protein [Microbacteriaceae bacterium]
MSVPGVVDDLLRDALRRRRPDGAPATVLIDGPAGAGKTSLAAAIARRWPAYLSAAVPASPPLVLLHMGDLYPGWEGLAEGSRTLAERVLLPRSHGRDGRFQTYDWVAARPGPWRTVPASAPLLVEGCGALSRAAAALATLRVWLDADEELRWRRVSRRDGGAFDDEWPQWSRQMVSFITREQPRRHADLTLRSDEQGVIRPR